MELFRVILTESVNNTDKLIEFLTNNYQVIVAIFTLVALLFKTIKDVVDIKKLRDNLSNVNTENKNVGKIIYEKFEELENKTLQLSKEVVVLMEEIVKRNSLDNEKNKLMVLLLQTANIPISQKNEFLKALNDNSVKGMENALKSLENANKSTRKANIDRKRKTNKKIEELDRL